MLKVISLWQPWADLIALGVKKTETRSWPTNYRGFLAIHAAKRWAKDQLEARRLIGRDLLHWRESGSLKLPVSNEEIERYALWGPERLGVVVAVAWLEDVVPLGPALSLRTWPLTHEEVRPTGAQDLADWRCGGFDQGRWGWVLKNVAPLAEPVPLRGRQGLWTPSEEEAELILMRAGLPVGGAPCAFREEG